MSVRPVGGVGATRVVPPDSSAPHSGTPWATPIRDGHWTDPEGASWHVRGSVLDERAARKLLRRPGVRVLHVYGPEPRLVDGSDLDSLLTRLDEFLEGKARPHADFRIADFRDDNHNVMAVVEENC